MEDRYEIRGKIGAGGLGTVYRGFDTKMNRQVAIKRIMTSEEDPSIREEATKQLAAEAGALASLQHPHIVTVYDVGHDEDGPYVVMELINGKTLDDIIEEHPLTWSDFRELAMQTQEALIAAQELNMIHSDLKPPNIMMTWLPSGKFQIKIVDFGLAMLAQNQSKEELATIETVFGSIFFMPPEQFEREVLDARSDLYSMGCVYYQCLTGRYPFMGYDGEEVMNAHLNHNVTPIQDIRADVPIWVCDWVMWQINRQREDRPQSAKEALAVFIQNNRQSNPEMSIGRPKKAGPKLIIPGASAGDPDAPEPIVGKPIVPPGDLESVVEMMAAYEEPEPEPEPEPEIPKITKAQPTGALLSKTSRIGAATTPQHTTAAVTTPQPAPVAKPPKPPMSTGAKAVIAVVLGVAIIVIGMMLMGKSSQNEATQRLNTLMKQAAVDGTTEVPMSSKDLEMVLKTVSFTGKMENRDDLYALLTMAKSTDGTNFDIAILNFAKQDQMLTEVRSTLIGTVLRDRGNKDIITLLLDYGSETTDKDAAIACFRAAHDMAGPSDVSRYLDVIIDTKNPSIRSEAERTLARVIDDSMSRDSISSTIASAYDRTNDPIVKLSLIRMLGNCSTDAALKKIGVALNSDDAPTRLAATTALSNWKDMRAIETLSKYLNGVKDPKLRTKAYEAMVKVASQEFVFKDAAKAEEAWTKIRADAITSKEQKAFINGLAASTNDYSAPWAAAVVQPLTTDPDTDVAGFAKKAVDHINKQEERRKKEGNPAPKDGE